MKTTEQKTREGMVYEVVEREKSRARKLATQNNDAGRAIADTQNSAEQVKGETRDIVSEKIGVSARTYEASKAVLTAADSKPEPQRRFSFPRSVIWQDNRAI